MARGLGSDDEAGAAWSALAAVDGRIGAPLGGDVGGRDYRGEAVGPLHGYRFDPAAGEAAGKDFEALRTYAATVGEGGVIDLSYGERD